MLLCLALQGFDFFATLERYVYDAASTYTTRRPSERIAIISLHASDSGNPHGGPGSRAVDAQLIDWLAAARATTVVHTTLFSEPQVDPGLVFIRQIQHARQNADAAAETAGDGAAQAELDDLLAQAQKALDTDALLSASMTRAGNVLLPSVFSFGSVQNPNRPALPDYAQRSTRDSVPLAGWNAQSVLLPVPLLGQSAAGMGYLNHAPDSDGVVRTAPLFVNYGGRAFASLALLAAAHSLGLTAGDMQLHAGASVQVGKLRIPTGDGYLMRPQLYPEQDGRPAFAVDAWEDVLSGKTAADRYAGKLVILDDSAPARGGMLAAPGHPVLSPAQLVAHTISSILSGHFYVLPEWGFGASVAVFLLVAAYGVMLLPHLTASQAVASSVALVAVLLAAEVALLLAASLWIHLVFVAMAALAAHLALIGKRHVVPESIAAQPVQDPAEANRAMGLALQAQGQLDLALECFCRATMGEALMGNLYGLALDYEHHSNFSKAHGVYRYMASFNPDYKDILSKLARTQSLDKSTPAGGASVGVPDIVLDGNPVDANTLGRYQLEKELGRGAMGVVYLGRDPTIGRTVAIKTLALSQEFAAEDVAEVRERFFREAETAGRLQHPHIVTIFDAGEERELAFIAMEFLKGQDLTQHCKPGNLLAPASVVSIVARVAGALAYAHRQNVVHRDIKPANIMFDAATDQVKVTDFGIARITDSSKTKTGLVLGTPSFMSPEQLSGKKVDGRSDLYSLGVMLFQLLTGVLPFRADSMSELMYKITNAEAADIRILRPELPKELADIVALSLSKRPETRYQNGEQFVADLLAVSQRPGTLTVETSMPAMPVGTAGVVGSADIEI
jgi:serine/threonine-protein kinase